MIEIKLKYNGYLRNCPRTGRKKYELENQKKLRVDYERTLKSFGLTR